MGYHDDVHENAKEFVFYTEIGKSPVTVKLDVGWIWIERSRGHTGWAGAAGKEVFERMSLTTEDAKKLVDCINKLVTV